MRAYLSDEEHGVQDSAVARPFTPDESVVQLLSRRACSRMTSGRRNGYTGVTHEDG